MIIILTLVLGVLLTVLLRPKKRSNAGKDLLFFKYPRWKNLNFHHVKKAMSSENVPKIFRGKWFPWPVPTFRGFSPVIISDFELMKEAFSKKELCSRLSRINHGNDLMRQLESSSRRFHKVPEAALEILGPDDQLYKNGEGLNDGIGDGPYDQFHRIFRTKWHQTTARLVGKNRIEEIVSQTSDQLCETIQSEMVNHPEGFDPVDLYMNGTLNVVTGFALGINYKFDDPDFVTLITCVKNFFKYLQRMYLVKFLRKFSPDFFLRLQVTFPILRLLSPLELSLMPFFRSLFEVFYPYIFRQIKLHRRDLDKENPRDFLDYLMIEAEENKHMGYSSVTMTVIALYLGASDTLTNQMRWLTLVLAERPELQEELYDEILKAEEVDGRATMQNCNLLQSVLLENFRCYPVADTLPHQATEDVILDGYDVPKGSVIQAWLTAIMNDPKNFENPQTFNPRRFIQDEKFVKDVRVCPFSVGLRNCIGKQLARSEYFKFSADIIKKFQLIKTEGSMEPAEHGALLMPSSMKIKFVERY